MRGEKGAIRDLKGGMCVIHLLCTLNNTHITVADFEGRTMKKISQIGVAKRGSKGAGVDLSDIQAMTKIGEELREAGISAVEVRLKGMAPTRTGAMAAMSRGLGKAGIQIVRLGQKMSLAHNGCRPPKIRRL